MRNRFEVPQCSWKLYSPTE